MVVVVVVVVFAVVMGGGGGGAMALVFVSFQYVEYSQVHHQYLSTESVAPPLLPKPSNKLWTAPTTRLLLSLIDCSDWLSILSWHIYT